MLFSVSTSKSIYMRCYVCASKSLSPPSIPVDSGSFFHPHIPHISAFFSYTTFSTRRRSLQMYVYNHQTSHADKLEALKTLHRTSILARESSKFHKNETAAALGGSGKIRSSDSIVRTMSTHRMHCESLRFHHMFCVVHLRLGSACPADKLHQSAISSHLTFIETRRLS